MLKLFRFIIPYRSYVAGAVALLLIQAWTDLQLPDYMADIVNFGVLSGDTAFIIHTGIKMLVVTLVGVTASIIVGFLASVTAASVSRDLRSAIFKKVTHFSGAELDRFSTASLITRTTNDITQIQSVLVVLIRMMFYAPILGVGGVIKAISKSTSMSWVIGVAVVLLLVMIGIVFTIAIPKFKWSQKLIDRLNLVARENIEGIPVIRAFNTQKFEENRFDIANRDLTHTQLFVNRLMSVLMPGMMLIMNLTMVTIVWVGARQVSNLTMDIGDMMAYMQYAMQIIMSFLMMSMLFIMLPRASVSADRIHEVLATDFSIRDPEHPETFGDAFEAAITFKSISFAYPGSQEPVLRQISFEAPAGKTTAIIGSTGSGKTTILNLILRFYDPTEGTVLIGGKDIRSITRQELRKHIGFVPQKVNLFSGTIRSNLSYADKKTAPETLEHAMTVAQATEFVNEKEEGMDSAISQGGTNVSGGQKQRLSIARALVKRAPITIFDDSFSALDLKTDRRLRVALKREKILTTTMLVAQRISTIIDADQILVVDNGRIVGRGTHRELLSGCQVYQEIARSQLSEEELKR